MQTHRKQPLRFLFHALGVCCRILCDYKAADRGRLARAYFWLQVKNVVLVKLLKRPRTCERFLGIQIHFFEYWMLAFLVEEIFVNKEYAFECDREDPVILDCGSNIGMATLYFKYRYPRARIIGFEPDPATFAKLEKNVQANGLTDVSIRNQAVWNENTTLSFFADAQMPGDMRASTDDRRGDPENANQVDAVRLAELIEQPIDFLKIDIEGAEGVVLEDLARSGKLRMIRQMVIEYHHHIENDRDNLSEMLSMLEREGFGYQFGAAWTGRFPRKQFQDILIYAYQKDTSR